MGALKNAFGLIITVVFSLYIFLLLIRLLMQKFRVSWNNPVTQFVIKLTEPVIKPLRKFIPGVAGFDLAIVLIALILNMIYFTLLLWLKVSVFPNILGVLVIAVANLGIKVCNIFFWCIIINAILSWLPQLRANPAADIVHAFSQPLLSLARRFIPLIGGIDISPIPVILVLWLIQILALNPLVRLGLGLSY